MLAHDFLKKETRSFTPGSSRSAWYVGLLILVKLLRCVGLFIVNSLAKTVHVVSLLWILKLGATLVLMPLQKPLTQGKSLRKSLLFRIAQLSFFNCLIEVLWFYGITFCGPLRSVLVFEQSPIVILAAIMTLVKGGATPSKMRGSICLIIGFLWLLLLDRDVSVEHNHTEQHSHHSGLNHLFYHAINWSGVADHKGGIILLMLALVIKTGYDWAFRRMAVEVGGPKRLYALVQLMSSIFLTPLALLAFVTGGSNIASYFDFFILVALAIAFVMVIDFYAESICFQHVTDPVTTAARWCPMIMFVGSAALAYVWWYTPTTVTVISPMIDLADGQAAAQVIEHGLNSSVFVTLVFFIIASFALTSPHQPRARAGQFVGFSNSGLPLYDYGDDFLQRTSRSILLFVKETLREILANSDSRRIFFFLCANLMFCGVEFLYGFWTNSLGLISDGFHMLFDCSALVMGLVASVMSRWPPSRLFSYGYGRVEVLSGFINALFLIVIAFFIFLEALERLYDPPEVHTEKLLIVSVAGLLVNLFGMYAFHGGGDDGHGHGHSHGGGGSHGHSHNANMEGVFLHVLADTLGSVFVIISTLLIEYLGWHWVDPFCSLILAILIFSSVVPLLRGSAGTLLQRVPSDIEKPFDESLQKVLDIDGVVSYSNTHVWQLKSELNVGTLHVQVRDDANLQAVRQRVVGILKEIGVSQAAVQVERDAFFHRITSLVPSYEIHHRVSKAPSIHNSLTMTNNPVNGLANGKSAVGGAPATLDPYQKRFY
uniref:Proton-coupled zinc antiporter SLC30A5 n=1 Tax=Plectus sambesii TaxID=2011161 RepID=A0A914XFY1_9BILA